MANKEIAERLREIMRAPSLTLENREQLGAIADDLDPQPKYPPYGVPVEVRSVSSPWYIVMSVGAGMTRVSTDVGPIREWDEWRIPPVDWGRVPEDIVCRVIFRNGDILWNKESWSLTEEIYHIDNRPEASDEV